MYGDDHIYNIASALSRGRVTPYYTGMVGVWKLMTPSDDDTDIGCAQLDEVQDAALYAQCVELVRAKGFDFVDAWYSQMVLHNEFFSHNLEVC